MLSFDPMGADPRRRDPRAFTRTFCSELWGDDLRHGFVVELSEGGVRVERPFFGGRLAERLQLEFEMPEIDEIVWASVEPCYDVISRRPSPTPGELGGLVRTSGFRLVNAAGRSMKMLRDVVHETRRRRLAAAASFDLAQASCYARG
jgi:hypothetical protein